MARRVFFSFHYQRDIWRANVVRNCGEFIGTAAAGFSDASLWEEAKRKGDAAIKRMIDGALIGTTVTVVLIGAQTASREYVNYEIDKSIERGNGILGIHIHMIPDRTRQTDWRGAVPAKLLNSKYRVYDWPNDSATFARWIEEAYANR